MAPPPNVWLSGTFKNADGTTDVSKSFKNQQFSGNTPISSQSLSNQGAINLSSAGGSISGSGGGSTGGTIMGNNMGLPQGALASAMSNIAPPPTDNQNKPVQKDQNQMDTGNLTDLVKGLYSQVTPVDTAGIIAQQEAAAGIVQKQQAVNDYTAQLNAINARAQAAQLSVVGQGRGIPEAIIGGQQAQIAREAAIQALPVAAQLSAAQGNLQMAQQHVDTYSKLLIGDAQNKREQQMNVINAVIPFATAAEQRRLSVLDKQSADKTAATRDNVNFAQGLVNSAIQNGNQSAAQGIMKLMANPNSPTFMQDVSAYGGQIQPKASGTGSNTTIGNEAPLSIVNDPTKTTAQNNMQTLQQVFQSSKVSAGNKTSIGNALALAQAAQDLANANLDGKFEGFSPFRVVTDAKIPFTNIGLPFRETFKRNKTIENESMISALNLQTQFWASGAALTEEQTKEVAKMIPTVTNTDTQIKTKVNQLINYMLSQTSSRLVTDGIDFKPSKVDVFETVNLIDKASPEQQAELKALGLIK
jgi:hypothetical protein